MIKFFSTLIIAGLLSGCAAFYTFDGVKYDNASKFQAAVDSKKNDALKSIKPLSQPITNKKLIAAMPSERVLYNENILRATKTNGASPSGVTLELIENLTKSNYKLMKIYYEAVQKRGIYQSIEIKDMPSMAVSIEPSSEYDVIYYTEPSISSGQFFYSSSKFGKQVFAFDRSQEGVEGKIKSFVDAIQVQAIRD